jgi:hypothetical protein
VLRWTVAAVAAAAAALAPASAHAGSQASQCPTQSFLEFRGLAYASETVPGSVTLPAGGELGSGQLDEAPDPAEPCKRQRRTVTVRAIAGIDPRVAVAAAGVDGLGFVLGARCSGAEPAARWSCLRAPLSYQGVRYTPISYPAQPSPQGTVALGEQLGSGTLGGDTVSVRALRGVDPSIAVGLDGRPAEAFVAPGVCAYERFSNRAAQDDLARCLRAPIWFTFAPPGGRPGERLTATGDRKPPAALAGASVVLARLRTLADVVPADLAAAVPIGTLLPSDGRLALEFEIPDLEPGVYEAVVRCDRCEASFGGTTFPVGSILVLEKKGGSTGATILYIVVFAALVLAIAAGVVLWMRGYRIGRRRRPPA